MTDRLRWLRGFTLIEILVALAIVAVALAAGMRALALCCSLHGLELPR